MSSTSFNNAHILENVGNTVQGIICKGSLMNVSWNFTLKGAQFNGYLLHGF